MTAQCRSERPGTAAAPDAALMDAALRVEPNLRDWAGELRWMLSHPAVGAVAAPAVPAAPLTLEAISGQHPARFPLVSGDPDWLSGRSMAVVAMRLAPHFARGARVALDLSALSRSEADGATGREQMALVVRGLESVLPGVLERQGVAAAGLALSVRADHAGLGELLRLRECVALSRPRLVIRVPDRLLMALRGAPPDDSAAWSGDPVHLWHDITCLAHRDRDVHLVLQHTTRPACALAAGERTDAVLPDSLFEVRAESAWTALRIRLDGIRSNCPRKARAELRRLLRATLRLMDNLVEQLHWASPEVAQDALVNRRIAVHVTGLGSLVDRLGLDPAAFATVELAGRWLRLARQIVHRESNVLARERGPFPGLELRDLASTLRLSFGEERTRRLLRQAGLRHRHLLVLSPFSVFPEGVARRPLPAYLNLLPVIRWADTIALHGDAVAGDMPLVTFRRLLRLTAAIAQNRP